MPVIGHALAGLAAAFGLDGAGKVEPVPFGRCALILVLLAYVPDIVAQFSVNAGFRSAAVVSHSLVFAIAAAGFLAPFWRRFCAVKLSHAFALTLVSLLLHDGMDILQSPGRRPLWPLPFRVNVDPWIPASFRGELLACLPFLIIAIAWAWRRRGWSIPTRFDWSSVTAVGIIVCLAASANELRDRHERHLIEARTLAEAGHYGAALEACDAADGWPSPVAPGRVDYVRAMSWWGLGRADRAEELYLRSFEADPTYLWTVADLAALYASSDAPLEERKRKAERWLEVLRDRFAKHPALPQQVRRVERRLQPPE